MTDKKTFSYPGDGKLKDTTFTYTDVDLAAPVDLKAQQAVADAVDAMSYSLRSQYISAMATGTDSDVQLTATQIRAMRDLIDSQLYNVLQGLTPIPTDPKPMADVLNCNVDWTIIPEEFVIRFGRDIAATWVNAGNPDRFVFNCADDIRLGNAFDPMPLHQQQYGIEFIAQKFLDREDDGRDYFHHLRLVPAGQDDMQKIVAWLVANT